MKYADHRLKGTVGYIRKQLVFEVIKTLVLFAMALGLFFIGYFTLHTKKSLWSVLAVLALLPACRSLVTVIMFARFRSLSEEDHRLFCEAVGQLPVIFENIITTSDRTYFLPVICSCKGNVMAYSLSPFDASLKEHLDNVLKNAGHKATVKIFNDRDAFIKRCREMDMKLDTGEDRSSEAVLNTLKAVSL